MQLKTMNKLLILTYIFAGMPNTASADLFKCNACPAGYKCDGTSKYPCSAGTFSYAGSASCTNCSAGYYQNASAQSSCKPCSAGTFSSGSGATSCSKCPAGYKCPGGTDKIKCPEYYYQDATGQSSCKTCPVGMVNSYDATSCYCQGKSEDCSYGYKEKECKPDSKCVDDCKKYSTNKTDSYCKSECYKCKDVNKTAPGSRYIYMKYDYSKSKCVEDYKSECRRK